VPNSPSPIPNTKQKASLGMGQRRPDGLVPVLGTVPVSGILSEGLYKYGLWTVTFMRYTRNTIRYISNACGRDGIFFLGLNIPPFLNRQFRWNRLPSPLSLDLLRNRGYVTIKIGTKEGVFCMILMMNGSATLSLLNKVCNSI
jgi:hypothetical protein